MGSDGVKKCSYFNELRLNSFSGLAPSGPARYQNEQQRARPEDLGTSVTPCATDGVSHGDYLEQLTDRLVLKLGTNTSRPPCNGDTHNSQGLGAVLGGQGAQVLAGSRMSWISAKRRRNPPWTAAC